MAEILIFHDRTGSPIWFCDDTETNSGPVLIAAGREHKAGDKLPGFDVSAGQFIGMWLGSVKRDVDLAGEFTRPTETERELGRKFIGTTPLPKSKRYFPAVVKHGYTRGLQREPDLFMKTRVSFKFL